MDRTRKETTMVSTVFDSWTKSLAKGADRRGFVKGLAALVLGASVPRVARAAAQAATPAAAQCPSPLATPAAPADEAAATPAGAPVCVGVREAEFYVRPERTTFQVGQPYVFAVGNEGTMEHEFIIEPPGADEEDALKGTGGKVAKVEGIAPGKTAELAWTFTEPGDFELACHRPGHYEAGMHVAIKVTA
jgi:uncharacterized cupredoxin-like copper-binding protein